MSRYLVTGGAGFIGSWLVRHLLDQDAEVVVLDDLSTGRASNLDEVRDRIRFVEGDAGDLDTARSACRGVDTVFHEAAIPSVPRSIEDPLGSHHANVTGTITVLEAARLEGVRRVVYAASSSAYGGNPDQQPKQEDQTPCVLSPYAAGKLAGEGYCEAYFHGFGLETVRLRYFNIFGPRQDPGSPYSAVLAKFCSLLLAGEGVTIYGDGTQTRDFTYIENVVQANWLAAHAEAAPGNVYNIGCGVETDLNSVVEVLGDLLGTTPAVQYGERRQGDPLRSVADISAAQRDLGYAPDVGLRDGLAALLASMRGE